MKTSYPLVEISCYLQSLLFKLVFINPKINAKTSIIGLKYIEVTPITRNIVFSDNGKLTVQASILNPNPTGNSIIANKQILVKFNFQIINNFSC